VGRPFLVEGQARLAPVIARSDWCAAPSLESERTLAHRDAIAEAWTRVAVMEHASVAAFARFVLELLALSAPAELVLAATRAQADEIRHAQGAFAIASAYAGRPIGPGALDVAHSFDDAGVPSLEDTVVRTLLEGCVGETLAALEAEASLEHVSCPRARALLERITLEEAEHAELAFRFVQWAVDRDASLVPACEAALARVLEDPGPRLSSAARPEDGALRAAGVLPDSERARLRRRGMVEVVEPCLRGLLRGRIAA
jgi:hypothetical protein